MPVPLRSRALFGFATGWLLPLSSLWFFPTLVNDERCPVPDGIEVPHPQMLLCPSCLSCIQSWEGCEQKGSKCNHSFEPEPQITPFCFWARLPRPKVGVVLMIRIAKGLSSSFFGRRYGKISNITARFTQSLPTHLPDSGVVGCVQTNAAQCQVELKHLHPHMLQLCPSCLQLCPAAYTVGKGADKRVQNITTHLNLNPK